MLVYESKKGNVFLDPWCSFVFLVYRPKDDRVAPIRVTLGQSLSQYGKGRPATSYEVIRFLEYVSTRAEYGAICSALQQECTTGEVPACR